MESVGRTGTEGVVPDLPRQVWAVGGGKGGVGKSLVTICLAFWLGRLKKRVVLVDADLGGANLSKANLSKVSFGGANLRYADLRNTNFSGADLSGADLTEIHSWNIIELEQTNLCDVKTPPEGFLDWAKEHGAVFDPPPGMETGQGDASS